MGTANRKTMFIDKELLSEANYAGSRLILLEDENLSKLQVELEALQKEINPVIDKLSAEYYPRIDPMYQETQKLMEQAKEIKAKIAEITNEYKADTNFIDALEQKAQLIKNKMQPIILEIVKDQLGEFETAKNTVVRDGKLYAEVFDEIEEKVKAIRMVKAKK